jgi:hypothetical protein
MRHTTARWFVAGMMAAWMTACGGGGGGDDDAATDTADEPDVAMDTQEDVPTDGMEDVATDAVEEPDGPDGTLTVTVRQEQWHAVDASASEGALVVLDAPGGERVEMTTDASGEVTFTGLDWSLGTADVTAYRDGYALYSRTDVTEGEEVTLFLFELEPPELVTVSGTAAGMVDEGHFLAVSEVMFGGRYHQQIGADWSLLVPSGAAYTLVALEFSMGDETVSTRGISQQFHRWLVSEQDAVTADATVDLDFSTSTVTPSTASGSFDLPSREDSPLRINTRPYVQVQSLLSGFTATFGFPTLIDVTEDGNTAEYDLEWIEPLDEEDVITVYSVGRSSMHNWVLVPGYPTAGAQELGMLDVITPVVPENLGRSHNLHDTFQWELNDEDVQAKIDVVVDGDSVWIIEAPLNATTLTVPAAPSTVDEGSLLAGESLDVCLCTVKNSGMLEFYWDKGALLDFTNITL